jgi:ParB family chromosome partitioning protein
MLRLLVLSENVQKYMRDGSISMGHARALITANNPEDLAKMVVRDGLSVRQTEKLAKSAKNGEQEISPSKEKKRTSKDVDTIAFEEELSTALGLKIELDSSNGESGVLKIYYKSLEQLDDVCGKLNNDS